MMWVNYTVWAIAALFVASLLPWGEWYKIARKWLCSMGLHGKGKVYHCRMLSSNKRKLVEVCPICKHHEVIQGDNR